MSSIFTSIAKKLIIFCFLFPPASFARGQLQLTYQQKKNYKLYSLALPVYQPILGPVAYSGWVSSTFSESNFKYINLEQGIQIDAPVTISALVGSDIYAKNSGDLSPYFLLRLSTNLWD